MATKEIHKTITKFQKGKLCLYNPDNYLRTHYSDVPVLTLSANKNYPTWLCLFPDGSTGGCYPRNLTDITIKNE